MKKVIAYQSLFEFFLCFIKMASVYVLSWRSNFYCRSTLLQIVSGLSMRNVSVSKTKLVHNKYLSFVVYVQNSQFNIEFNTFEQLILGKMWHG